MPSLTNIRIEHYRGFYERRNIAPAVPNGEHGSGLTVLVGPNNSGKTTVVTALRVAAGGPEQVDVEHRHRNQPLLISLTNDANQEKVLTNPDLNANTILAGEANAFPTLEHLRIVPSRRAWNAYTQIAEMESSPYWQRQRKFSEQEQFFVSRLAALSREERERFNSLLKEILPQLSSWRIELSRGQTFVQYETQSGARHSSDLFGDGMASLFRVALSLFDSVPGQIVVIDEPELSLHPQAQKLLASALSRASAKQQIVVTTHSPYFVSWSDLASGSKVYRLTQLRDGVHVGALKPETVADLNRLITDWQKPNLLDAVAREVFFAENVVFVEGQEDVGLLRKFSEDRDLSPLPAFGYGAGGFGNIKYFLRMAADLGIPSAAIFDGDHADAMEEARREFQGATIELLPTPDIRDKPRRDDRGRELNEIEKVGLFDRRGAIKAEYESYLQEMITRVQVSLTRQN
jgi:predicted ATP-dependent endonuclease of OLD family